MHAERNPSRFRKARHSEALAYSRRERLRFWLFRRWPRSVVERRLVALAMDERDVRVVVEQDEQVLMRQFHSDELPGIPR